jgi:hypothetical protein
MSIVNVKMLLGITDNAYDDILCLLAENVSRAIDQYCDRFFYCTDEEIHYYDTKYSDRLDVKDLCSLTKLEVDNNSDGIYETEISLANTILYPLNTVPKYKISLRSESFPVGSNLVKITGTWGYSSIPQAIRQACLMQTSRWFKRKDTAFASVVAAPELGQYEVYKGLDADVQLLLDPYRWRTF